MRLPPVPELDLPTTLHALAGDTTALACLYTCHRAQVLDITQRMVERLHTHEGADELAQEVWFRLLDDGCRRLRCFDPARASFGRFLQMVAWQQALVVAMGWVRRQEREPLGPWEEEDTEPSRPPEADELDHRQLLARIIDDISPRMAMLDRMLFEEVYIRQARVSELALRISCSTAALHKRNQRLRARLHDAARRIDAECSVQ
jgi:RNA polymerase sigma factor (sigma-70 family)